MLTNEGAGVLLNYGDPSCYGIVFEEDIGHAFVPPYPLKYPFGWMGLMMNGTILPVVPPSLRVLPHCQNQSFGKRQCKLKNLEIYIT